LSIPTAASIAVAAFQQGRRVFMLELDRQWTLSDGADARPEGEGPEFEHIDATALDKALATLREGGLRARVRADTIAWICCGSAAARRSASAIMLAVPRCCPDRIFVDTSTDASSEA
jgi:hypothetical protein